MRKSEPHTNIQKNHQLQRIQIEMKFRFELNLWTTRRSGWNALQSQLSACNCKMSDTQFPFDLEACNVATHIMYASDDGMN